MVGTAPARVGRSAAIIAASGRGLQEPVRHEQRRAGHERRVRQAPGHRVEHRHHGQHPVRRAEAERLAGSRPASSAGRSSGGCRPRPSGCRWCRRCSRAAAASFSSTSGQSKARRPAGEQVVPAVHRRRRRAASGAEVAAADHHDVPHGGQVAEHPGQQRDQRRVDDDHPVLGVVGDVDELLGEEPDVERVQHRAHARHREVGHQVLGVVPHERARPARRRSRPASRSAWASRAAARRPRRRSPAGSRRRSR